MTLTRIQRRRPSSALLCLLFYLSASSLPLSAAQVVINDEYAGTLTNSHAQLAGRLGNLDIEPGSFSIEFLGVSNTVIGAATDSGGSVTGTYAIRTGEAPDKVMTGTVNYFTGRWVLKLEDGGFGESTSGRCDYTYTEGETSATTTVAGEYGGAYPTSQSQFAGRLGNPDVSPGSATMVFVGGGGNVIGMVTDDGNRLLVGSYSVAPVAAPAQGIAGTINYATGRWTMESSVRRLFRERFLAAGLRIRSGARRRYRRDRQRRVRWLVYVW